MDNETAWALYFSAVVAMERHPGKTRDDAKPLSIKQCALLADMCLEEHADRWTQWRTQQQPQR